MARNYDMTFVSLDGIVYKGEVRLLAGDCEAPNIPGSAVEKMKAFL